MEAPHLQPVTAQTAALNPCPGVWAQAGKLPVRGQSDDRADLKHLGGRAWLPICPPLELWAQERRPGCEARLYKQRKGQLPPLTSCLIMGTKRGNVLHSGSGSFCRGDATQGTVGHSMGLEVDLHSSTTGKASQPLVPDAGHRSCLFTCSASRDQQLALLEPLHSYLYNKDYNTAYSLAVGRRLEFPHLRGSKCLKCHQHQIYLHYCYWVNQAHTSLKM